MCVSEAQKTALTSFALTIVGYFLRFVKVHKHSQLKFSCLKSATETLKKGVRYVQSYQ